MEIIIRRLIVSQMWGFPSSTVIYSVKTVGIHVIYLADVLVQSDLFLTIF